MAHYTIPDERESTYANNSTAWRKWLANHWDREPSIWLIIYKKDSGISSVTYNEAVDEALCFGWIDSKPNKRDDKSYYQFFAKRNPKSNWSKINKDKITRLEKAGKIAPPGFEMIRIAKETGTWNALDQVEQLIIPQDLQAAFDQYPNAALNFTQFPKSVQRGILEWIFNAKRPQTRKKRIDQTASKAEHNERANQYRK